MNTVTSALSVIALSITSASAFKERNYEAEDCRTVCGKTAGDHRLCNSQSVQHLNRSGREH